MTKGTEKTSQIDGFTAAQTMLNILETIGYIYYLWIVYHHGSTIGRGLQ
jgi:hypothetical protein